MTLPESVSRLKREAGSALFRWTYKWHQAAGPSDHIVVLFFNRMWDAPLSYPAARIPADCEITTDRRRLGEAAAVVFHIPSLGSLRYLKKLPRQVWVAWSMECEAHYPQLRDEQFMSRFDWRMTYHRHADIPVPYYYPELEEELRRPGEPHPRLIASFVSGRHDRSGRVRYAAELMRHIEVHSYGRQHRNRTLARDTGRETKLATISGYQFTLAFENAIARDYVTEKFYDPLIAGSVPVYLGAPNAADFAPGERCYVDVSQFENPRALAEYLAYLNANEGAYREYLHWKQRPFRSEFTAMLQERQIHPFVRLCHAARALRTANRHNP